MSGPCGSGQKAIKFVLNFLASMLPEMGTLACNESSLKISDMDKHRPIQTFFVLRSLFVALSHHTAGRYSD